MLVPAKSIEVKFKTARLLSTTAARLAALRAALGFVNQETPSSAIVKQRSRVHSLHYDVDPANNLSRT